ncbi:hypothetical protein KTQ74_24090 [Pseudomonas chlororaphis]|uniref:hypothetical protein n=1 Tax=Pseudomonas chlororaphis TaxID=587753 RepID=UPI001E4D4204|nr:hypothetical protein [Pseudomonas chlororaphis]MCB2255006.1 hypothetical protein [Pseudomonas chlororaphis]
MVDISTSQLPPPQYWQEFESLCRDLWALIWEDENTQKNGRSGQNQSGVDISGKNFLKRGEFTGIQCKGKDNYADKKLSIDELEAEVRKAKKFRPELKVFILATSGPKDVDVEQRAREISQEHEEAGLFQVVVHGWIDILERLANHAHLAKRYYPWIFHGAQDPFSHLFEFWKKETDLRSFEYNCSDLPFYGTSVRFSESFIQRLYSSRLKLGVVIDDYKDSELPRHFKKAILNFNKVVEDLVATCYQYQNKYEHGDIYIYWVDVSHLSYDHTHKYIAYRSKVLMALFYALVQAANLIIKIKKQHSNLPNEEYVAFRQDENDADDYPIYTDAQIEAGEFYPGLYATDYFMRWQTYPELKPSA